ncbi:MAG: hypothetical protein SVY53_07875 [Chloroflexota bacterium]|nr:hypothetical protein [Chloroflexota bacterium]
MASGTDEWLEDVWGTSGTDVFALGHDWRLGTNVILHYDGSAWTPMQMDITEQLRGIWGSSPNNVFAAGLRSTILHYDGSVWTPVYESTGSTANLNAIWGSSPTDVFAVGEGGIILHFNGTVWTQMDSGLPNRGAISLEAIWGTSSENVFVVGYDLGYDEKVNDDGSRSYTTVGPRIGLILHYDGETWTTIASQPSILYSVWGSSSDNVFAVGEDGTILHYDGDKWNSMISDADSWLKGVWGSSPDNVFAVGYGGTILHYDGSVWARIELPEDITGYGFHAVWGSSASDIFFAGSCMYVPEDGIVIAEPWGPSSGQSAVLYYDGKNFSRTCQDWASVPFLNPVLREHSGVNAIWGSSAKEVFFVDRSGIWQYDGIMWTWLDCGTSHLEGIWGSSEKDIFAVGGMGTILHYPEMTSEQKHNITSPDNSDIPPSNSLPLWGWILIGLSGIVIACVVVGEVTYAIRT